jgi:hypothetical protein
MSIKVNVEKAMKNAAELADRVLLFDAEIGDLRGKYSALIATLATAGFGLTISNVDKLSRHSWTLHHTQINGLIFLTTSILFLIAMGCSAGALAASNKFLASFKQQRTLTSHRAFIMMNHPDLFEADSEVRLVMQGKPIEFIPDLLLQDLLEPEAGALIEMEYDKNKNGKDDEGIGRVFRLRTEQFRQIYEKMIQIRNARCKLDTTFSRLILMQGSVAGLGYFCLLLMVSLGLLF